MLTQDVEVLPSWSDGAKKPIEEVWVAVKVLLEIRMGDLNLTPPECYGRSVLMYLG